MVDLFISYWYRLFGRRRIQMHESDVRGAMEEMSGHISIVKYKLNTLKIATDELRRASELAVAMANPSRCITTDTGPSSNSIEEVPNGTKQAV